TLLDRPAEATAHFERALALNARMGARTFLAYTQQEYAGFLAARAAAGDRERAEQLAAESRRAADELGMVRLARLTTRSGRTPRHAPEPAAGMFRRAGDWWWVGLAGEPFRVADAKGVRYLAALR